MSHSPKRSLYWFRKCLRLHDNPALLEACHSSEVFPVFCIDPHFVKPDSIGVNRFNFLLESLIDLDSSLRSRGSRLLVLRGNPEEQILSVISRWGISEVTFESDTEPYSKLRDSRISAALTQRGVIVRTFPTHTLRDLDEYVAKSKGRVPPSYQSFIKLFLSCGPVRMDLPAPAELPQISMEAISDQDYSIPTLLELGYTETPSSSFKGGESHALQRLYDLVSSRPQWVNKFSKPDTAPNSLEPSTTVSCMVNACASAFPSSNRIV